MGKKKKTQKKPPTFEQQMTRLEEIADELESGELGLEKAIERYEEGVKSYRECHKILSSAEKKVEILTRSPKGDLKAQPFEGEEEKSDAGDETDEDDAEDETTSLF